VNIIVAAERLFAEHGVNGVSLHRSARPPATATTLP
jgi:AcrR family transcriptional regulator